jgi:hypothetical protein
MLKKWMEVQSQNYLKDKVRLFLGKVFKFLSELVNQIPQFFLSLFRSRIIITLAEHV